MTILDGINRFIGLFIDALKQVGRGRIWLWLLVYFAVDWFVLYAFYKFESPFFYGSVMAWAGLIAQDHAVGFSHYPGHFLLLQYLFEWAKLAVGLLIEGLLLGAAALLFYESFVRVDPEDRFSFRQLSRSWIHLVLGFVVLNAILVAAGMFIPGWFEGLLYGNPRRQLLFNWVVMPGIYMFLFALLMFIYPAVAIYRDNVIEAIGRSVRMFIRNPITCLFLAGFLLVIPVTIANIVANPNKLIETFRPEFIYWVLTSGLVVDLVINFLWMGTTVLLLIDREG